MAEKFPHVAIGINQKMQEAEQIPNKKKSKEF